MLKLFYIFLFVFITVFVAGAQTTPSTNTPTATVTLTRTITKTPTPTRTSAICFEEGTSVWREGCNVPSAGSRLISINDKDAKFIPPPWKFAPFDASIMDVDGTVCKIVTVQNFLGIFDRGIYCTKGGGDGIIQSSTLIPLAGVAGSTVDFLINWTFAGTYTGNWEGLASCFCRQTTGTSVLSSSDFPDLPYAKEIGTHIQGTTSPVDKLMLVSGVQCGGDCSIPASKLFWKIEFYGSSTTADSEHMYLTDVSILLPSTGN
jgi:hypothetical protein